MSFKLLILIICYQIQNLPLVSSWHSNPLDGQHLRVIWPRWKGNPPGLTGPIKGGVIIDTFAERFNFTYEMVRVTENRLEPQGKERGLFNYLWENQCDLLVIGVGLTYGRFKVVDVTTPMAFEPYRFLIPVQDDTANINAVIKPFQWPVWLGLVISMTSVVNILQLLEFFLHYRSLCETSHSEVPNTGKTQRGWLYYVRRTGKHYIYVFGNLMSQGGHCRSNRLSYRLVAGVWCLSAFILVQAYTSILFTYIVTPINQPLINSVYDIVEHSDIQFLVRKGSTLNQLISDPNATGILLKLRKKLNSFPNSQCNLISECIDMIKPGSRTAFADANSPQRETLKRHFDETQKCNVQLASESFLTVFVSMALQKHSRYTDTINRGLMELRQSGLMEYWDLTFHLSNQCTAIKKIKKSATSISLKNLTGAFLVLLIGLSLSFLAFLFELIFSLPQRQMLKTKNVVMEPPLQNAEEPTINEV